MSANNYILIHEKFPKTYEVSERDFESDRRIKAIGTFDDLLFASKSAEDYIRQPEQEVEYGVRFRFLDNKVNTQ